MKIRSLLILVLFTTSIVSCAQEESKFDYAQFEQQVLAFTPVKSPITTEKEFEFGKMVLRETVTATKGDPKNFRRADYFNVLSAFTSLNLDESSIKTAFAKFRNSEGSCEYFIALESTINTNDKYSSIRPEYQRMVEQCNNSASGPLSFDLEEYAESHQLDLALLRIVSQIKSNDSKFREIGSENMYDEQSLLDTKNQQLIEELYGIHGNYLGRSLVGKEFEEVMWTVIQHGPLEMMEKYLPIVHRAVQSEELSVTPLKMLIDRYYGLRYGYQVFGSQTGFGFQLAGEDRRVEIATKYNID